jgi:hypothetical protein
MFGPKGELNSVLLGNQNLQIGLLISGLVILLDWSIMLIGGLKEYSMKQ